MDAGFVRWSPFPMPFLPYSIQAKYSNSSNTTNLNPFGLLRALADGIPTPPSRQFSKDGASSPLQYLGGYPIGMGFDVRMHVHRRQRVRGKREIVWKG